MIDYVENLSKISSYRVEWDKPMSEVTFESLYEKIGKLQGYRYSIVEMFHEAIMERVGFYEKSEAAEINYDNKYEYTLVNDSEIKELGKSDKIRQAMAGVKTAEAKKEHFIKKMELSRLDAYIKVLGGWLEDIDRKTFAVQQQTQLVGMDLKIHPDKIKILD